MDGSRYFNANSAIKCRYVTFGVNPSSASSQGRPSLDSSEFMLHQFCNKTAEQLLELCHRVSANIVLDADTSQWREDRDDPHSERDQ